MEKERIEQALKEMHPGEFLEIVQEVAKHFLAKKSSPVHELTGPWQESETKKLLMVSWTESL